MSFTDNIKSWVTHDNKIKNLNEQLRSLREERNNLESQILNYIKTNQLHNKTITISDGELKYKTSRQSAPLTYKFIQDCLSKCIKNNDQVDLIMKFIKEQREFKETEEIKRQYN